MRKEQDILGTVALPDDALYGINTARAAANFDLQHKKVNPLLLHAMITVKKAAAVTYRKLGVKPVVYQAMAEACDQLLEGTHDDAFITEALQGGAGTSTHMNVNEVLANLTLIRLEKQPGDYQAVHPLDDINRGQSTNDVYPTALRIAAVLQLRALSDQCACLQQALQEKEQAFAAIQKLGRTELMDAVEITLGEECGAWAQAIARDRWRLYKAEERLRQVNIGGAAVGVPDHAKRKYRFGIIEELRQLTGIGLAAAEYPMDITQNNDVFVEVSGLIKALAVNQLKICNDLRLMNSGPNGGYGEIRLKPLQQGSTIMPGKVNPVIPEMVMQCAMRVIANDMAITLAAEHGEFELNAFLPLIADSLLESLGLMCRATAILCQKGIEPMEAREDQCRAHLARSAAFGITYTGALGYDQVSRIVKEYPPEEAIRKLNVLIGKDNS